MHPDRNEYVRLNRTLVRSWDGNLVSPGAPVRESGVAAFRVREARARLYDGGLGSLVLAA